MFIPKKYKSKVLENQTLYQLFLDNRQALEQRVPSTYDMTKKCNMSCLGCLFFEGDDYASHSDNATLTEWALFFQKEKDRGVTYGYFAGAEPSLVEDRLSIANKYLKKGCIFTNGSKKIDESIKFKIHISVWGLPQTEKEIRKDSFFLQALKDYKNDTRAVFVFTINALNINDIEPIIQYCKEYDAKLTFNLFSPTSDYLNTLNENPKNLMLTKNSLITIREKLDEYIEKYEDTLIYTKAYNHWVTNPLGLYKINPNTKIAENCATNQQKKDLHYRTDFSSTKSKCCLPNLDCKDCRAYTTSLGTAIARYSDFMDTYEGFIAWNTIVKQWRDLLTN